MSTFKRTNTVEWPCIAKIPKNDGSKKIENVGFKIKYKILSNDEMKEIPQFIDQKTATNDEFEEFIIKRTEAAINAIEGWDFTDMDFKNPADVLDVTNDPYYRSAIVKGFWEAQNGGGWKNLKDLVEWIYTKDKDVKKGQVNQHYCLKTCALEKDVQGYCNKCPSPGLLPENESIWQLFEASQTQLILSFGGVVGFNYIAVQWVADRLKIDIDSVMFHKLRVIENHWLSIINKQDDPKAWPKNIMTSR